MAKHKSKSKLKFFVILLSLFFIYIWIIFPLVNNEIRDESDYNYRTDLWHSEGFSKLTYHYLEREKKPSLKSLQESFRDSIFLYDFYKESSYSRTIKDPNNGIIPSTNNYSITTQKCYSLFLSTGDSVYFDMFLKASYWIKNNADIVGDSVALWRNNDFVYDKYSLEYGWPSAFSQGFNLSVLSRAFQETKDSSFLKVAEKAVNSYNYLNMPDGFAGFDKDGYYWYFEYPAKEPGYVLNGMIFGLLGLYDYYRITGSDKAKEYFYRGVRTLKENLYRYDCGYWSSYDLHYSSFLAGYFYHKYVHIPQLDILYQITNDKIFKDYHDKFVDYLDEPYFTMFKLVFTFNGIQRYLTYKNPIKLLQKERFDN